ncbi:MAG: bifunctional rhamnulose-1-phosphate aldolase/short-chain dehydrogenase [Alphaproteobacteria bacterium]|nr:bifunctional rhamnulose-1-phosphate aldolase/short-chain dehydrogenase [Alphaproteobacteria bacterium]
MTRRFESFRHVNDLWRPENAARCADEVELLVYRSRLLGADLRITNFAGGNTSCKAPAVDAITGERLDVLWVKGSGGDLGTMTRGGLAALRMDRMSRLRALYRGHAHEDGMVPLYAQCVFGTEGKAPSIDTPLHALLPARHVDHLHPDAVIAIAAAREGAALTQEIFEGRLGWIDWLRPGFELGVRIAEMQRANPGLQGIVLGGHGVISWAETSEACYRLSLDIIETAGRFLAAREAGRVAFGGLCVPPLDAGKRREVAAAAAPILRGLASGASRKIGHFVDAPEVLAFAGGADATRLSAIGTSCPDHFLRTKVQPLLLDLPADLAKDAAALREQARAAFAAYAEAYRAYYDACRDAASPPMRDDSPVVVLWPGIGMFTFAADKQTARVAGEYFVNAINVMRGAEALGGYVGLPRREAFGVEYWQLEEAKLRRRPPEKRLARRVALVSGAAGGIGLAIAERFLAEGAAVMLLDRDAARLDAASADLRARHDADRVDSVVADLRDARAADDAFTAAALAFGGVDILVNNAGLSVSGDIAEFDVADYDLMQEVMARGAFLLSRAFARSIRRQRLGGDILYIASKNGVAVGPSNVAYGSIKAAQAHQARLLAAELGKDGVRVNVINPDAVIRGSGIWAHGWAEGRAKAYGITVDELPAHYAKRTLLNVEITPDDVAAAALALVGGELSKTTGAIVTVDGGVPAAFPR